MLRERLREREGGEGEEEQENLVTEFLFIKEQNEHENGYKR